MKKILILASVFAALVVGPVASAALIDGGEYPAPTITIYATPATIVQGGSATLTWVSKGTYSCKASGAWSGAKARSGSTTVSPSATANYYLTCSGRGGTTQTGVTLPVTSTPPQPPTATTTPPIATTTPPVTPTTTPTTTPPTPPQPTTTPPTQPPVQPPATCPSWTVPVCAVNTYPTPGAVDAKGCITSMRCTSAILPSTTQLVPAPSGSSYPAGSDYAGTQKAGTNAAVVYPNPSASITFGLTLDKRNVWWVTGKVGLSPIVVPPVATTTPQPDPVDPIIDSGPGDVGEASVRGATYGGSVLVTITAFADKIDSTDKDSEVLYTATVSPTTGAHTFKLPLGVWAMRPNLKLIVATQKTAIDTLKYGAVIDGLGVYTYGSRPDQGIVNNDPEWKSVDQQNKQLTALAQFPVAWIHDSIRTTGASWPQAPLLKREQDLGKKIQLVIGPFEEDYDLGRNAGTWFPSCDWYAFPLSKVNWDKYEQRLKNNLTSYKAAGVDVRAVEVGNELDLSCFNSDVPLTRAPTDADYKLFAESYAKMLERTVSVVKRPEFYPNAKIILGSSAIDWTVWNSQAGSLDPGKMYAPLKNLNGKNYFALVDGITVHYYPKPGKEKESIARTQAFLSAIGETNRPVWLTEWGFTNNSLPQNGIDRYRAFVNLYDQVLRADHRTVLMANFALDEFTYPFHLVDASYNKLPEARFFDHYPSPVPSTVAIDPIPVPPTACTTCAIEHWVREAIAIMRDFFLIKYGN